MGEKHLDGHRHICGPCWISTHSHAPGVAHCDPVGGTLVNPVNTALAANTQLNTVILAAAQGKGSIAFEPPMGHQTGVNLAAYGQRLDVPGPMMRTVRDPSLSLSALSGLDDASPAIMVEPPDCEYGAVPKPLFLTGRRIGFASSYRAGSAVTWFEHPIGFSRTQDLLRAAGVQLVPLEVRWSQGLLSGRADAQLDDALPAGFCTSPLNELLLEQRLDAWMCDAQQDIFPDAITDGYSRVLVSSGSDPYGLSSSVLFYGARWGEVHLKALVRDFLQALRVRSLVDA